MARAPLFLVLGYGMPAALLAANLLLGYGGILATMGLFVWIGVAVLMSPTEEEA